MPPPPVPPRPRLIPAHYANYRKQPETRDVACNTSDRNSKSFAPDIESTDNDVTLIENTKDSICSRNTTQASLYLDARSHLTESNSGLKQQQIVQNQWSSDEDTIHDDLSSLSSQYQSIITNQSSSQQDSRLFSKNESFLHRNSSLKTAACNPQAINHSIAKYDSLDNPSNLILSEKQISNDGDLNPLMLDNRSNMDANSISAIEVRDEENGEEILRKNLTKSETTKTELNSANDSSQIDQDSMQSIKPIRTDREVS